MIHNITEYSEDARVSVRLQYAVRLTYSDGRVRVHIRESRQSAENMVGIHRQLMVSEPDWAVIDVDLIQRTVRLELGEWEEAG